MNEAIPFPRSRFARLWRHPLVAKETIGWLRKLRARRYDLVLDCQGLGRSGLIAWATLAPRRVGFRNAREFGWMGYNVRHQPPDDCHTVDHMLGLLDAEGIPTVADMRLYLRPDDREWWTQTRRDLGSDRQPYAVLAPTSRWASKRWPASRWRELIGPLAQRGYERVVIVGSPDEIQQVRDVMPSDHDAAAAVYNLVGTTSVGQTMAVIEAASLVIANDSAPLHMAVGFDRPVLALFGPTDPEIVGPYRRRESVIRPSGLSGEVNFKDASLGDSLMRRISVADVLAGLTRLEAGHVAAAAKTVVRSSERELNAAAIHPKIA